MNYNGTAVATDMVQETEGLIERINDATRNLMRAIENERVTANRLRDAEQDYESAESEGLFSAVMQAQMKEGPLAGLAATSKAYGIALDNLKVEIRTRALPHVWDNVNKARAAHDEARIALEQAQVEMGSLKKIADLRTAMMQVLAQ